MKHDRKTNQAPRPTPHSAPGSVLVRWVVPILCLLLAAGGTWGVMEFVVWNKLPGDLVGKWEVQGGDQDGATFDFFRNGTMVARINVRGKLEFVKADVAVEGDGLFVTTRSPIDNREMTKRHTIKVLSANRLVLEDERKNVLTMERLRE